MGRAPPMSPAARLAWLPPLAARLAMGARFVAAGIGKTSFYFFHFDSLTAEAAKLGLSASVVRVAVLPISAIEIVSGLAVVLGLHTRPAALMLLAVLATYAGLE